MMHRVLLAASLCAVSLCAPSVPGAGEQYQATAAAGAVNDGASGEQRMMAPYPQQAAMAMGMGMGRPAAAGYMPAHGYGYQCYCPAGGAPVIRPYYPPYAAAANVPYAGAGGYGAAFNPYTNVYAGQAGVDAATAAFSCGTVCGQVMARCQTYCYPTQTSYACAQCLGQDYQRCQRCYIYTNAGMLRSGEGDEAANDAAGNDFNTSTN